MRETVKKGNFTGGKIPYGYRVTNKKFEIVENEAKHLRYAFNAYAKGIGKADIVQEN